MTLNIVVDLLIGAIPLVGDLFDVYWKANRKNVELLRRHLATTPTDERRMRQSDGVFVVVMVLAICAILLASVTVAYLILAKAIEFIS